MPDKEEIPDEDIINRSIYLPQHPNFDAVSSFVFDSSERSESVIWRKYARTMFEVHAIGCAIQARMNLSRIRNGKSADRRYRGAIEGIVARVRQIRSQRSHGLVVEHEPHEGEAHAEIAIRTAQGAKLKPNDVQEIREHLGRVFSPMVPHAC